MTNTQNHLGDQVRYNGELPDDWDHNGTIIAIEDDASGDQVCTVQLGIHVKDILASELSTDTDDIGSTTSTSPASTTRVIADYQARPLTLARRLLDIGGIYGANELAKRDYLRETGSPYADSEPLLVDAAFSGHVMHALESLADAYEREITHA